MSLPREEFDRGVVTERRQKIEIEEPPMYKVLLLNDDYTSMEFVVMVLETIFHKPLAKASQIMLNVHHQGKGVAGIYTREVADTKVALVHNMARKNQYPLKCSIEKE